MTVSSPTPSRHLFRLALFCGVVAAAPAQAQRAMTVEDLLAVRTVSDPQISPNGELIAFTVTEASLDSNRNISRVWIVPASGGAAKRVTEGPGNDRSPRWAPCRTVRPDRSKG